LVVFLLALDMGGAAHDLARSVSAAVAHEPVTLNVKNVSSLGAAEAAEIRRVLEAELKAAGQQTGSVDVTISENLTEFVLAAEVRRAGERQVFLESWPRTTAKGTARVTLDKRLLWEQDQPILDAARSGDTILVLDSAGIQMVRGEVRRAVPIPAGRTWPRDLRGHLALSLPAFTAWLPGTICRGAVDPQLSIECQDSQEPWLLGPGVLATFATGRNFFAGHIFASPGGAREVPPFYSGAPIGDSWVLAGVDGRTRVYTAAWEEAAAIGTWDGDVAALQSPCGTRILVAAADSVQPFEVRSGTAIAAGPALEFAGSVTALWSAGESATVIAHDLETGHYAAYSLAPACGS
jgi:hypothetical protein